jgi:rod shape determining protein RodA
VNHSTPLDYLSVFKPTTRANWNVLTPFALLGLSIFGIAFIYSAQFSVRHTSAAEGLFGLLREDWFRQMVYLGIGACIYVAVSLIDYRFWLSVAHWFYAACLIPLLLVLVPGIGGTDTAARWGAQRWINLGVVHFQPSETAKIGVLLITASILVHSKVGTIRGSLGTLGKLALAVGAPMFLIYLQPDLKSLIVLPPMVFSMLYVSKLSSRFFLAAFGAFMLLLGAITWDTIRYVDFMDAHHLNYSRDKGAFDDSTWFRLPLHDYQRNRFLSFVDPDRYDPVGIGWNQRQSIISVGSGGLTGKGWTEGTQAQLGYLPRSVAHNDFIFAVIAEERGFLGSLTVLGLFGIVLFNGIRTASHARDRFGTLLAIGVTVLFAVHVFVNIAMTIGLVPITGIPLPFISYGGSFVLSCCLLQGLVQSVWRFRRDFI